MNANVNGLNPCSTGITFLTKFYGRFVNYVGVLILVLLE